MEEGCWDDISAGGERREGRGERGEERGKGEERGEGRGGN